MFKDYYKILEITESASKEELKAAFKKLAIKWHPDKNPGIDTTSKMQELNEAYLVLKDKEGRERYDVEYKNFRQYNKRKESTAKAERQKTAQNQPSQSGQNPFDYADYEINDEVLRKWMDNARKQAVNLAKQSIEELKGMVVVGVKEGYKAILYQILGVIIVIVLFGVGRSCNAQSKINRPSKSDIWFNNTIRWVSIKTPAKFVKHEIDYQKALPDYKEKINVIENYNFKSRGLAGMFLYMDTQFEAYLTEVGLKKTIENLLYTGSAYNLQMNCNEVDNQYDDTECSGTFDTDKFKGFIRGYCIWIDKKVYSIVVFSANDKEHIALVDSVFNSIKVLR